MIRDRAVTPTHPPNPPPKNSVPGKDYVSFYLVVFPKFKMCFWREVSVSREASEIASSC